MARPEHIQRVIDACRETVEAIDRGDYDDQTEDTATREENN